VGKIHKTSAKAPPSSARTELAQVKDTVLQSESNQESIRRFVPSAARSEMTQPAPRQLGLTWRYEGSAAKNLVIEVGQLLICDGPFPVYQKTISDPIYGQDRTYEGYLMKDILEQVPDLERYRGIQLIGEDNYKTPPIPLDKNIGASLLAIRDLSASRHGAASALWEKLPPHKDGSPRGTPENPTPGPAYLVWPNDNPNHDNTYFWPYQVARIELIPK
jgi:hypothetical protein